jgi:hypothetical protein
MNSQEDRKMEIQPVAHGTQPSRRWLVLVGIAFLQILLMAAAFVGGRMLASQDQRNIGQLSATQLPSQLPKDPAAGSGTVQKVQSSVITLSQGGGPGGGGPSGQGGPGGESSTSNQTEVTVTAETKYYKSTSSGMPGMPGVSGGGQTSVQVQEASLTDVKVGNMLMVWGTKNGEYISAEVIYIQQSFGP